MTTKTFMRIPKSLLKELKALKQTEKESYAETVKILLDKNRKRK